MSTPRQLGLLSATALVVANMIGTGVFTTSGFLLADLKSPWAVLAVWALGGVHAALGALSYGALARRIPESGGEYLFLSRTLHPAAGTSRAGSRSGWLRRRWPLRRLRSICEARPQVVAENQRLAAAARSPRSTPSTSSVARGCKTTVREGDLIVGFAVCSRGSVAGPPSAQFTRAAFGVCLVWVSFSYLVGTPPVNRRRSARPGAACHSLLLGTAIVTRSTTQNTVSCSPRRQELAGKRD